MADPRGTEKARPDPPVAPAVSDLAAEAERARTPRTPFLALAGVWLVVAAVVAIVVDTVMAHVETLAAGGLEAGSVGDETPLRAFADAVRRSRPHHILIFLRAADHSAWQERQLIDRVREAFHIPITVFEIDHVGRVPAPGSRVSE
jgi:hypothetical protein